MRLKLERLVLGKDYTEGKLYINDRYFCDTIEDVVRPKGEKVFGKTAIAAGRYSVIINMSARFKKKMPLLLDVPNFQGVRLHSGNTAEDSEGCIIVGIRSSAGIVGQSRVTFNLLMEEFEKAKSENHTIEIVCKGK